jgi:hypothetical protein
MILQNALYRKVSLEIAEVTGSYRSVGRGSRTDGSVAVEGSMPRGSICSLKSPACSNACRNRRRRP